MPRIAPGTPQDTGRVNALIARVLGVATGSGPPNVFTTLGRHRRLFRPWLRFAGRLMPGGTLPRRDSELVILRVAHLCGSDYEWAQHEQLGATAGLAPEHIAAARAGPDAPLWTPRQRLLLSVTDELHGSQDLTDASWDAVRAELSDVEAIELCMLVGHYVMLAMTLNALRVEPDPPSRPPRAVAALQRRMAERDG